jgi:monovalent cation:proton antiporter-2 (CPA2) family protein
VIGFGKLYTIFINAFYERSHFIDALSRASHRNRARTRVALLPHPHDVFVAREVVMFAMRPSAIAIAAPARVRGPSAKATRGTAPVRSASNASSKASLPRAGLTTRGCAMQVTSASALRVGSARGRTVVRRATPEASSDTSDAVEVPVEDPALAKAAAELAAALEQMATERESLTETTMEQRQREAKALESQEDLELVATKQAQLAATAWEEHAESEEAVARRSERSDAAFEAMGECEIVVNEIKARRAVLETAIAAELAEDDIPSVDDAAKVADGAEKAKKVKKSEQWWLVEDLTMETAMTVIVERLVEAEVAFEKSKVDKASFEEKYVAGVQSAEMAKERARAADQRAADAMTAVEEMMERVLEARVAWSEAESSVIELDEKRAKLVKDEGLEEEENWVKTEVECEEGDEECLEALQNAVPANEMPTVDADTLTKQMDKSVDEEPAAAKFEKPKTSSSSKYTTGKYFSSSEEKAKGASLAAGIVLGIGFFVGMFHPGAMPLRKAVSGTAAQVTATVEGGYKSVVSKIPESERKLAEHAYEEAHEAGLLDALVLLFTSICAVTLISKMPGGSPVLGFLIGGAVVGPYMLNLIGNVEQAKILAEFGVVFLLFNIGLELSLERLTAMARLIFGMGAAQMVLTTIAVAGVAVACGLTVPQAVVVGMGLAFSSTAVALQVLQDRGESGARHGRATFSVLLFQDLTVVLVFMLVPLLAGPDSGSVTAIAGSLIKAIFKTVVAIGAIMVAGRGILRPVYNRIAKLKNAEVLIATTLFTSLGTSLLTQSLGLSMALGAFLAGLLLAETEFHLQVESDIAPFRGLLLGLFFMTVGMQIDPATLFANFPSIIAIAVGFLAIKMGVMAICGPLFGVPMLASLRAAVYIAPGGEFAFVTYGLAAAAGLLPMAIVNQINLAVVLTMAMTPLFAR